MDMVDMKILFNRLCMILPMLLLVLPLVSAKDFVIHNTTDESDIYFVVNGSTGFVGIGIGDPKYLLHVGDTSKAVNLSGILYVDGDTNNVGIGTSSPVDLLTLVSGSGVDANISFGETSAAGGRGLIRWDAVGQSIRIGPDATGGRDIFLIEEGGSVGIGTTDPERTLHVNASGVSQLEISSTTSSADIILDSSASSDGRIIFQDTDPTTTNKYILGYDDDIDIFNINTGSTFGSQFVIDSSGNVGIGTTTPATTLDVQGNANISGTLSVGSFEMGSSSASTMNITGEAITFTGENGSLYQPTYGTDDDLVLYLPFSRGGNSSFSIATSNESVYDRSPYGNDGQCYGTDLTDGCNWTSGKYGNALFF